MTLFDPKLKTPCGQPVIPSGSTEALKLERARLGITPEIIAQRQRESLSRTF